MSIRLKLTIMFLAIATMPLLFVSALTFTNYENSIEANRFSQLQDLTIFRADSIDAYFAGLKAHIEISQGFYNIKKNLPVLTRLADDPGNQEFLMGLCKVAHSIGITVVALGVEQPADLALLAQLGFDGATGPGIQ